MKLNEFTDYSKAGYMKIKKFQMGMFGKKNFGQKLSRIFQEVWRTNFQRNNFCTKMKHMFETSCNFYVINHVKVKSPK